MFLVIYGLTVGFVDIKFDTLLSFFESLSFCTKSIFEKLLSSPFFKINYLNAPIEADIPATLRITLLKLTSKRIPSFIILAVLQKRLPVTFKF